MPQNEFEPPVIARTVFNPITGETIFELRMKMASSVHLVWKVPRKQWSSIRMSRQDDSWSSGVFLRPGRYEFGFNVDGVLQLAGVVEVRWDYRYLADSILERLALIHTCCCHTQKWN